MKKTVVELFAGVGGFRVGLNKIESFDLETGRANEKGDWDFVWANQWEPSTKIQHAFDCYTTRFGSDHVSNDDIHQVTKNTKKHVPPHSLLVGGFPCQDYSVARSLSGNKGIEGKKGVLFWDIVKILEEMETPFFLLENVDRLLKSPASQRGRDFGIMLRTLTDLNYDIEWRVINAAEYGRGQRRRRVFIFGWKNNLKYSKKYYEDKADNFLLNDSLFAKSFPIQKEITNKKSISLKNYKDTIQMTDEFAFLFENTGISINGNITTFKSIPLDDEKYNAIPLKDNLDTVTPKDPFILTKDQIARFKKLKDGKSIEREKPNGEKYFYTEGSMSQVDSLDLPGRTMLTSEKTVNRSSHVVEDPSHNKKRFLTPIEAERLQDFPDNWTNTEMPLTRRYFMMGNALVTGIITMLESELAKIVENE